MAEDWKSRALKAEEELSRLRNQRSNAPPHVPKPEPLTLDPRTTALLVLDLSNRCNDPEQVCSRLVPLVNVFLQKVRAANVFTLYTVSASEKDTPREGVWDGFDARSDEPVLAPDAFDKFHGGELDTLLKERGIKTVIITGASTNNCVLFTATAAAKIYGYRVVIPLDGVIAKTGYEMEYPLHQLVVMPGGANKLCSFSTLEGISFKESA